MEIIPVIDVMGGKLVHARGGERANYPLLTSTLTTSHDPIEVIRDLLAYASFSTVYIADLDAIILATRNSELYTEIARTFPDITFYLDAGVTDKASWHSIAIEANIYPVIGSETLLASDWIADAQVQQGSILSLDFKHGEFLGEQQLLSSPSLWPQQVIAMNLDCIAAQGGPDLTLLADLKQRSNSDIIAAGGVRSEQDLMALQKRGIKRVLVASALHDGRIEKTAIKAYLDKP